MCVAQCRSHCQMSGFSKLRPNVCGTSSAQVAVIKVADGEEVLMMLVDDCL